MPLRDASGYAWPVSPLTSSHPVRGNFGDPRGDLRRTQPQQVSPPQQTAPSPITSESTSPAPDATAVYRPGTTAQLASSAHTTSWTRAPASRCSIGTSAQISHRARRVVAYMTDARSGPDEFRAPLPPRTVLERQAGHPRWRSATGPPASTLITALTPPGGSRSALRDHCARPASRVRPWTRTRSWRWPATDVAQRARHLARLSAARIDLARRARPRRRHRGTPHEDQLRRSGLAPYRATFWSHYARGTRQNCSSFGTQRAWRLPGPTSIDSRHRNSTPGVSPTASTRSS